MREKIMISVSQWILKDIIGITDNRSARVQELLMKGHLYEKEQISNQNFKKENQNQIGIMRETSTPVRYSANFFDRISEFAI